MTVYGARQELVTKRAERIRRTRKQQAIALAISNALFTLVIIATLALIITAEV